MKSFSEILKESTETYDYVIRTIVPVDNEQVGYIKEVLAKYGIVDISKPEKSFLQDSPRDFPNAGLVEIYTITVKTTVPASSYILGQEIREVLNIPDCNIVVRGVNEPLEIQNDIDAEKDQGMTDSVGNPLLSTDPAYHEVDESLNEPVAYGDDYNKRMLAYLAKLAKIRKEKQKIVQPENQESVEEYREDAVDFNKDYDTVKPVPSWDAKDDAEPAVKTSMEGNFQSSDRIKNSRN